jgi:hypothetical protein
MVLGHTAAPAATERPVAAAEAAAAAAAVLAVV